MIKLSPRLERITHYIPDHCNMIDIGCDHGLLDIYLAQSRNDITIIASDINQKALNGAIKNIKKYGGSDKITTMVSDGLTDIDTTGIDTIVISGMGAHTMVGILYSALKKIKNVDHFVLQSNNDLDFLRYKITKIGYYIEYEELVKDTGIIYTIIVFARGHRFYSQKQLYFGPCLLQEQNPLFQEKCEKEWKKLNEFYPLIPNKHYHHRLKIRWKLKQLKKILTK